MRTCELAGRMSWKNRNRQYNEFMSEKYAHTHDPEHIRKILNRFSRSIGHLEKVRDMVETGEDCSDVLIQLAAVRGELNRISQLILKEHLDHCIVHAIEDRNYEEIERINKAIDQLIK